MCNQEYCKLSYNFAYLLGGCIFGLLHICILVIHISLIKKKYTFKNKQRKILLNKKIENKAISSDI